MSRLLARYTPSPRYLALTLFAVAGAILSAWVGVRWAPSWIAAALFGLSAIALAAITLRPAIEIHETHLRIGRRLIGWDEIRRVDCTSWNAPLAVHITLRDGVRFMILYPGDPDSSSSVLRHIRRHSREALLDGTPYGEFWGEAPASANAPVVARSAKDAEAPPKYPLLRPEDEDEVERMFQKLKSVGRLESKNSDED